MPLDLEEQEQVAELKAWWRQHGNRIAAIVLAVAVAFAAWQGWRWYQAGQAAQAAALYDTLARAAQAGDAKALREAAGVLAEGYGGTLYASMGALSAARFLFDKGDLKGARAQLQWVLERSSAGELRDIARLRLAAVLLDEKRHDEALKVLQAPHAAAFEAQYAVLRGDILLAKGRDAEARAAYRQALEKAAAGGEGFRAGVQMRLDALGG